MNRSLFNIIKVEREGRSLSTLILSSPSQQDWLTIYSQVLLNLVNASGSWTTNLLESIKTKGISIVKIKT